jgi:hypothetical protein
MKNRLLFLVFTVLAFANLNAQSEFRLGAKGGINFSTIGGDFTSELRGMVGFHVGGLAEIPLLKKLSLQPEILYSTQGARRDTRATDGPLTETKLGYINIPVMSKYYILDGLSVMAGPQLGILVAAKNEVTPSGFGGNGEYYEKDIKDELNSLDIGLGIGAEYRLPFDVFFQMRYVFGLTNVNDESTDMVLGSFYFEDVKNYNNVFQISAGYSF